ncbi:MAG TPA: hypothetical protein VF254_11425 [Gammaproteobacteria bacterium]
MVNLRDGVFDSPHDISPVPGEFKALEEISAIGRKRAANEGKPPALFHPMQHLSGCVFLCLRWQGVAVFEQDGISGARTP